ncbi:MAG: High-affinity branched-chain amino acid transport ATP-binding protein LivF [Acidimicrobiaceae bacterium]|nr:branched-chain amino acid ABC transporter ATP-binding protein [Acidimicrobiaceae bacterium]CAI8350302.1 MAG: High-affinity branched-chain amino acid transport ATP-binding protein LivF [Acidimicrobiaceae bacterium]
MLEVESLTTRYGSISALRDVGLSVGAGEVVCLIGPNGAGKTTLLSTISGLLNPVEGSVKFENEEITSWSPDRILRSGLALVPEHRRIFGDLTVDENLLVGGVTVSSGRRFELKEEIISLFPVLGEKLSTEAGYLSGGEAQQLAIGRALMSEPKILLMDEPALGLAPVLAEVVFELISQLRQNGQTLLVVEQNARRILEVADRGYVMRSGRIVISGDSNELISRDDLFEAYIGKTDTTHE